MGDLRMPDLNRVFLAGNLTRDPELTYLQSGTPLCKMGLAVSRRFKDKSGSQREETMFINVTAWSGTAEYCGQNLQKGRPILVEGSLRMSEWDDKQTGQKRTAIEVNATRVHFLDWEDRGGGGGGGNAGQRSRPQPRNIEEPLPEDDIPF